MTPPVEHTYVCLVCNKTWLTEPLKCDCGARAIARVDVDTGGARGLSVGVKVKERKT